MSEKFANQRVATTLNGAILAADLSLVVDDASGLPSDGTFRIILGQGAQAEIVAVSDISGVSLTGLVRGAEGTTARDWPNNTAVAHILTAAGFDAGMSDKVTAHEAAGDPHPTYQTSAESQGQVDTHSADTTSVHGITDTSALSTSTASQSYTDSHIATHEADTTNIHGITNTASLETTTGAQTKADTARTTAVSTAEAYTDTQDAAHVAASDPHTPYLKESELGRTYNVRSVTTGTSDDTAAIQALHDAAADGDTIFVQPGTYTVSQLNWTKKVNIVGLGTPENVIFAAKSGMTGPLLNVSFATLKHHLRIENLYLDMQAATGQVGLYLNNLDLGTISNIKVREGTVAFDVDSVAATDFNQCWAFNNRTSGFRVKNAAALDNTWNRCFVYMTSGALADMSVAGFDIQAGGSNYLNGVRILRQPGISHFMPYGIKCDSALTTDWLFLTNVVVDASTDGTGANSASSAGLYLKDCTGVFAANCFFSAADSSGQKQRGVRINGGSRFQFSGGRISGSGLEFLGTVDTVDLSGVDFPSVFADAALYFGSATVTNLTYKLPTPGGALADDNVKLSAATASTKGYMGGGRRMLVSDATAAESFILEHASTGKTKRIRVNNGSTGTLEFLGDNGTTKLFQITDAQEAIVGGGSNRMISGTGTPEGTKSATVGSMFFRTDGGTSTTLYLKESGSGNTGWVALGASAGGSNQDAILTKAGAVSDADFTTPTSGQIGLDTTNHRLYVRDGSTWRYVEVN